jgi:hypothetical protein
MENRTDLNPEKGYNLDNDIANKLGYILLKKGVIDSKTLVKAVLAKKNETLQPGKREGTPESCTDTCAGFQF